MDHIVELIENEAWEDALGEYLKYSDDNEMDDEAYIVGATIMEHYREYDSMLSFIRNGLKSNPGNYELYVLLGNYYSVRNTNQAYLSYENAVYHCLESGTEDDLAYVKKLADDYRRANTIDVRNVSFVILSYNTFEYTRGCIESIRKYCFKDCYEIVVVDNASLDGSLEWLRDQSDIILIENTENQGFPAGCNQGINSADPKNDILLLNNDTIMMPESLFWLRMGLYRNNNTGAAGAVTNSAGNDQIVGEGFDTDDPDEFVSLSREINIPEANPYESKSYLVMFAMLIRRSVIDEIGLLDERFSPGNFEDNDYGMRLFENGYDCVLCHNCFIYHFGSKSFGRDVNKYLELYMTNREKFRRKWGFYSDYYTHSRKDVLKLIESDPDDHISVLEIGCGLGGTLEKIRYQYPNSDVHGVEIENTIADIGGKRYDIVQGDIENMTMVEREYDYILFPDVLEHLRNPEILLIKMQRYLKPDGRIIASIPNIMNATVIHDLLLGNFTYQDAGILDRTHLRFFTLNEIKRMFLRAGLIIDRIDNTVLPDESTEAYKEFFDELMKINGVGPKELFDTYQYIVRASKGSGDGK